MTEPIEDTLHRLEKELALLNQQTVQTSNIVNRLYKIVAGNGNPQSLSMRLISVEQRLEIQRQQTSELTTTVTALSLQQRAWRNQAIGISVAVSLLWIVGLAIWNLVIHLP